MRIFPLHFAKLLVSSILFCLFFSIASFAKESQVTVKQVILQTLPKGLHKIQLGKNTKSQVKEILGEPAKVSKDGKAFFYQLDKLKYDTTIGFKNDRVQYFLHEPDSGSQLSQLTLDELKSLIPEKVINAAYKKMQNQKPTHEKGRVFKVVQKEIGLVIDFNNNSRKNIRTVIFGETQGF